MKLKYKSKDDIPNGLEGYYKESGGEWVRIDSKIEGVKSIKDFEDLSNENEKPL